MLPSPLTLPLLILALSPEPGQPIMPGAAWAVAPDDGPRSYLEQVTGRPIDPRTIAPIRDGNLVYDAESMASDMLKALDIPVFGLDHEPTPGVLYVAMDGVTLSPTCNSPQTANAARNCSPLVNKKVDFPALDNPQLKAAEFQKLAGYYADFDLVMSSNRPPDYLPYTMAVVGGTSQLAGQGGGVCGIANVACDGAKRNHVSLTFSGSCGNDIAEVAAQETAHNWGLEHTDVQSDLMYPYVAGGSQFRDECMPISHATGSGQTQCGYVHKSYCPGGAGEQQNSRQELLGVFGPRTKDTTTPTLVSFYPEDGATFTTADTISVTATFTDDSNFIGVNWSWSEGLPADLQATGYRRCTNDVCDDNYSAWKPIDTAWDFVLLKNPPAGTYKFKVEAMDAYGNHVVQNIGFTVVGADGGTTGATESDTDTAGSDSGSDSGGDPTDGSAGGGSATITGGADDGGNVPTEGGGDGGLTGGLDTGDSSSGGESTAGGGGGGGGCRVAPTPGPASLLVLLLLGLRRRPRRA